MLETPQSGQSCASCGWFARTAQEQEQEQGAGFNSGGNGLDCWIAPHCMFWKHVTQKLLFLSQSCVMHPTALPAGLETGP